MTEIYRKVQRNAAYSTDQKVRRMEARKRISESDSKGTEERQQLLASVSGIF